MRRCAQRRRSVCCSRRPKESSSGE
jgi:hypothetical protein